ncbi:hypothetical protein P3T18_003170 [Paraburkholderia sp. GAS199]|uniref:DUF4148 domain-containing protein n=1 Tax=Paraburkholderia sp. GAS199 TaxID=3035126 RepID=UPI003D21389A
MKTLLSTIVLASALAIPAVSFAQQSNGGLTRAQVRAEIVTAQQAGLLNQNDTNYPKAVPSDSATAVAVSAQAQDVGGSRSGSSAAGVRGPASGTSVQDRLFSTYRGQ